MRRLSVTIFVVALIAVSINLTSATPVYACSCGANAFSFFDEADVELAFVGTVSGESKLFGLDKTLWTFETTEVLVGEIGPTVRLRTPTHSASCGLSAQTGTSMAVIAFKEGRVWATVSCDTGSPAQAAGFGNPHPPDPSIGAGARYNNRELAIFGAAVATVGGVTVLSVLGVRRRRVRALNE